VQTFPKIKYFLLSTETVDNLGQSALFSNKTPQNQDLAYLAHKSDNRQQFNKINRLAIYLPQRAGPRCL
jgi:hypothetical protein